MGTHIDERGNSVSDDTRDVRVTTSEARQGRLGKPVLVVLVCGLLLALIAWAGAELFGESVDRNVGTNSETQTPSMAPADGTSTNQPTTTPPAGEKQQLAPTDQDPTPHTGSGG
ncbi:MULTISPECIES: hypothetical protein [unclassified Rhizobium]|uniref:hypothetical protein n=1 Tax=unclassified Rhizobium TaxID=2613769 RepID=UPI0006F8C4A6|nr:MULTISPECIES: hypothetical protein [unclassified Rhizobium]KQV34302.1 hypothetical protein ASC86_15275 [Rhizobium sp. Root1212]KRD23680.1 hypothetical protein ASE37_15265 [Rhizobium sp. Root268]